MSAFAVHQCYQQSFANTAIHSIAFPVTDPDPVADLVRPLRDDPVRLNAVIVGIPGLNSLSPASKVLFCGDFRESPQPYVSIDCRYTKRLSLRKFLMPAATDHFRRPIVLQSRNDILPFRSAGVQCLMFLLPTATDIEIACPPMVVTIAIIQLTVLGMF